VPARIVVVHSDSEFLESVSNALQRDGHDSVVSLSDSMAALSAMEFAETVELLITGTNFQEGKPNGISLALVARRMRPNVKILFAAPPEDQKHADGLGEFLPAPVSIPYLIAVVRGLLN
jgi:two-component SAPR family response regulator